MKALPAIRARLLLIGLCVLSASNALAFVGVSVDPQTVTVGEPVTVSGISDCEVVTVDFGDGSPTETFGGPVNYSTIHVYTQPSPNPPGIWLVSAQGVGCLTGENNAIISVIVNPGPGGGAEPPPPPVLATGNLLIERVNLHFENLRPQIRVQQYQKNVQAFAQIQYAGTGLLQGYWEVDGRVWSFVNRHLVFGNVVTLESPATPGLPTVSPGGHRVRFVITQPATGYTPPVALYFAGYDEVPADEPLMLASPAREAHMPYREHPFRWTGPSRTKRYEITFLDAETGEPVFTALSEKGEYALPGSIVEDRFAPGRRYLWQVTAYGAAGEDLTRSVRRAFTFTPPEAFVPNQILVLTEFSLAGSQTLARLRDTYGLRELESHRLESLNLQMTLFETRTANVTTLSRTLEREEGVILAHPNFILHTLSEPHARFQKVHSSLNLQALHERARGRSVRVAIIDSGIDAQHEELKERITLDRSFVENGRRAAEIHGTAIAGVIGASLNGIGIAGIAPETELLALRACVQIRPDHPKARCETVHLARALDAALVEEARVVNMSFGTDQTVPLVARLIEKGAESGVLFVAPVGNASWQREVAFPARHPAVLAVGGQDESGGEYPNPALYKASRIVAPATNVFSSVPGDRYNFLSGTSLSAAIVSGLIALTLEQRALTQAELPAREPNLCAWTEQLTKVALCTQPQLSDRAAPAPATSASGVISTQ